HGAQTNSRFESGSTDSNGVAKITYSHSGPVAFTANTATVMVRKPGIETPVAANVACMIKTGPNANTPVQLAGNVFEYPAADRPAPVQYDIECTVMSGAAALQGHIVRFDFETNN